jgi:hypothetical protein
MDLFTIGRIGHFSLLNRIVMARSATNRYTAARSIMRKESALAF